jgi:hypothetical protein
VELPWCLLVLGEFDDCESPHKDFCVEEGVLTD